MSESKGSRDVSLGPYRSTEIALEDRLTRKEAGSLFRLIQKEKFGITTGGDFSVEEIVGILPFLGYRKEASYLYVRQEPAGEKFIYVSFAIPGPMMTVSGNYCGDNHRILSCMESIKDMYITNMAYHDKDEKNIRNTVDFMIGAGSGVALGKLASLTFDSPAVSLIAFLTGFVSGLISTKIIRRSRYYSKIEEYTALLSRDVIQYSFGKMVYDKIVSEYHSLAMNKLNTPKLESSELKQLPESKETKK